MSVLRFVMHSDVAPQKRPRKKRTRTQRARRLAPSDPFSDRTIQYRKDLSEVYHDYIQLDEKETYIPRLTLKHSCKFCGMRFHAKPATMLKGKGCTNCRTSAKEIENFIDHLMKVDEVHGSTFVPLPQYIPRFTGKRSSTYQCTQCRSQLLLNPSALESIKNKFKCPTCAELSLKKRETRFYVHRISALYSGKIACPDNYSASRPMLHVCTQSSETHRFREYSHRMLEGEGCPTCRVKGDVKCMEPMLYRNRRYLFKNKRELQALKALTLHEQKARKVFKETGDVGKQRLIKTRFEYPIPALLGGRIPAFFIKRTNTLVDVFSRKKFVAFKETILRNQRHAKQCGFNYEVVVCEGTVAACMPIKQAVATYTE